MARVERRFVLTADTQQPGAHPAAGARSEEFRFTPVGEPETSFSPKLLGTHIATWPPAWALSLTSADIRVYMPLPAQTPLMIADYRQGSTMALVATKDAAIAALSQVSY
jgi:hypothetical protein